MQNEVPGLLEGEKGEGEGKWKIRERGEDTWS